MGDIYLRASLEWRPFYFPWILLFFLEDFYFPWKISIFSSLPCAFRLLGVIFLLTLSWILPVSLEFFLFSHPFTVLSAS